VTDKLLEALAQIPEDALRWANNLETPIRPPAFVNTMRDFKGLIRGGSA